MQPISGRGQKFECNNIIIIIILIIIIIIIIIIFITDSQFSHVQLSILYKI